MPQKKPKNPFYILLMVVGTAFALTVCAYGVMMVRMGQATTMTSSDQFFDAYGLWIMGVQLTLLTLLTFAAIGSDDYWMRRAEGEPASTEDAENSQSNQEQGVPKQ